MRRRDRLSIPSEWELFLLAFGPEPEPKLDGAGRDCFAALMRERRSELAEHRARRDSWGRGNESDPAS